MTEKIKQILEKNRNLKKLLGVLLILVGLLALVTPFTPGSWLVFVGLELLGIRFLFWAKIKEWWKKK